MWGEDKWANKNTFVCQTCMFFVQRGIIGRCRRRSPTLNGWPVMHLTDWCGDHKIDEDKLKNFLGCPKCGGECQGHDEQSG